MALNTHFKNIQQEIIAVLSTATKTVHAAVAWLTDVKIINTLDALAKNGVMVEVILNDDDTNKIKAYELQQLKNTGATLIYFDGTNGLMHHKFCIVDESIVIMGSYNWTYSAANSNKESIVIINEALQVCADFLAQFKDLKIQAGVNDESTVTFHNDTINLKTEILFLEVELSNKETEKIQVLSIINDYEISLKQTLGGLIIEKLALELKLSQAKLKLTQKQDEKEDVEVKQSNYNNYYEAVKEANEKTIPEITETEKDDLKKMYRESMMMAHPDRFYDQPHMQEEANKLSAILSDAYKEKNFKKVKEIWDTLKDGFAFKSQWFQNNSIDKLTALCNHLRNKLLQLEVEITALKKHHLFVLMEQQKDINQYFDELRITIEANIEVLKNEIKKYPNE